MAETKELHEELNDQGNLVRDKIATIVKGAQATDRDLTDEEETLLRTHEAKLESIERQVELAQKAVHREAAHVQGMAPVIHTITQAEDQAHRTNGVENVYNPRNANKRLDEGGRSFLADIVLSREGGIEGVAASERLELHKAQMRDRGISYEPVGDMPEMRATSGNLKGLVPPQYLIEEATPTIRSMRPTVDALGTRPLPPQGMSFNVPQVTQGTTAVGEAEGTVAANQDVRVTDLTFNVKTIRSWVEVSVEGAMRGVMVDDLLTEDLQGAVETRFNTDVIVGAGGDTLEGLNAADKINATTNVLDIDQANPNGGHLYAAMMRLAGVVAQHRFQSVTHFLMHPRRLGWLLGSTDTTGRPLWQAGLTTAMNTAATGDRAGTYGVTQVILGGVPLISDAAVPTTIDTDQDGIYAIYGPDMLLYESPLMIMRNDPVVKSWTNVVSLGRFVAFQPRFDTSAGRLSGTLTAAAVV